ncbi:MAG: FecR family protein [Methyloglobulus sp.]|nr:FecR family protein [Methyloglobulus sp.]
MLTTPIKPSADQYKQASYWVSLLHDGDCSPQQHRDFQVWLSKNTLNQQAYQEVEAYWQDLGALEAIAQEPLQAARASIIRQKQTQRRWLSRQYLAIAASVLLLVIAAPFIQLCLDNGNYQTAKGEQKQIQLSDGSLIDLNTDTKVRVSYTLFTRKVTMEHGEALFTVKHDADKPFEVAASGGIIRDIGTQFNVYQQADKVSVTVLEGEVSVSKLQATTPQMLTAGMQYTYSQNGPSQLANNGDYIDVGSWREGRIVFKGQRLDVVLEQLSRYHAVKLNTSNPKLAALKVSGNFPTNDLNLALNTIAASLPVKISRLGADRISLLASGKVK